MTEAPVVLHKKHRISGKPIPFSVSLEDTRAGRELIYRFSDGDSIVIPGSRPGRPKVIRVG